MIEFRSVAVIEFYPASIDLSLSRKTHSFEPPATRMVSPVIQRASATRGKHTTEPTSSGRADPL